MRLQAPLWTLGCIAMLAACTDGQGTAADVGRGDGTAADAHRGVDTTQDAGPDAFVPCSDPVGLGFSPGTRRIARPPVVVVIFTGGLGALVSEPTRHGVEFARELIFRNSHASLDFDITYVVYDEQAPPPHDDWKPQAEAVAQRLIADGHTPGSYYGMFWTGPGTMGRRGGPGGTAMGFLGMGSGAECIPEQSPACSGLAQADCEQRVDCQWDSGSCSFRFWHKCRGAFGLLHFPAGLPAGEPGGTVDYEAAWLFLHEFAGHGIENNLEQATGMVIYNAHPDHTILAAANVTGSGADKRYIGPPPLGSAWDVAWMGGAMRTVPAEHFVHLPCPSGVDCTIDVTDTDGDGLADEDDRLPMDEKRLGSDPTRIDSDSDCLSDLQEYAADIFGSADPNQPDSDGDGRYDGADPLPRFALNTEVLQASPQVDGELSAAEGWTEVAPAPLAVRRGETSSGQYSYDARAWLAWDADFLYLAVEGDSTLTHVRAGLDGDGSNTVWIGQDAYDMTYRLSDGALWFRVEGDDTHQLAAAKAAHRTHGERVVVEIAIPRAMGGKRGRAGWLPAKEPGLALTDGAVVGLGLRLTLSDGEAMFTPSAHRYLPFKLRVVAAPPAAVQQAVVDTSQQPPRLQLTLDAPAQGRVCVSGAGFLLPHCELMQGMELRQQLDFPLPGLKPGQPYTYRVQLEDFDDRRSATYEGQITGP